MHVQVERDKVKLRTAHYNRYNLLVLESKWIAAVILETIHAISVGRKVGVQLSVQNHIIMPTLDNTAYRTV